jgi:hypothetical protein
MRSHVIAIDPAMLVPGTAVVAGVVLVLLLGAWLPRGPVRPRPDDRGILPCPATVEEDLLSSHALQCWLPAPNGRWRTLSRVSAHGALVAEVEASDLSDAEHVARLFVADGGDRFSEILIYTQPESTSESTVIRRIRWTQESGFEALEFTARPAR